MRVVLAALSLILLLIGLLASAVSVFAIFDPVGTQMADDNNPFSTPSSLLSAVLMLLVDLALGVVGGVLARKSFRKWHLSA
jgi:hypothetical protein